jgi:hypothetical protein
VGNFSINNPALGSVVESWTAIMQTLAHARPEWWTNVDDDNTNVNVNVNADVSGDSDNDNDTNTGTDAVPVPVATFEDKK